jgi:molybdate transport system regulatory protein
MLGFHLLETVRGGQEGGSTKLSPEGKRLVKTFDTFHQRMDKIMQKEFVRLLDNLNS